MMDYHLNRLLDNAVPAATTREDAAVHQRTHAMRERATVMDMAMAGVMMVIADARVTFNVEVTIASSLATTSMQKMTAVNNHPPLPLPQ